MQQAPRAFDRTYGHFSIIAKKLEFKPRLVQNTNDGEIAVSAACALTAWPRPPPTLTSEPSAAVPRPPKGTGRKTSCCQPVVSAVWPHGRAATQDLTAWNVIMRMCCCWHGRGRPQGFCLPCNRHHHHLQCTPGVAQLEKVIKFVYSVTESVHSHDIGTRLSAEWISTTWVMQPLARYHSVQQPFQVEISASQAACPGQFQSQVLWGCLAVYMQSTPSPSPSPAGPPAVDESGIKEHVLSWQDALLAGRQTIHI